MNSGQASLVDSGGYYTLQYLPFIENQTRELWRRFDKRYEFSDMLSEATMASLVAEKKYDPGRSDFSGYIKKRIEGAIIRSVTSTTSKQQGLIFKVYRWIDEYVAEHNALPTLEMALLGTDTLQYDYEKALSTADHLYRIPMEDVTATAEDLSEEIAELHDEISRLPWKYRHPVLRCLADKAYNKHLYKAAIIKLKEAMNA